MVFKILVDGLIITYSEKTAHTHTHTAALFFLQLEQVLGIYDDFVGAERVCQ